MALSMVAARIQAMTGKVLELVLAAEGPPLPGSRGRPAPLGACIAAPAAAVPAAVEQQQLPPEEPEVSELRDACLSAFQRMPRQLLPLPRAGSCAFGGDYFCGRARL